MPSPNQIGTRRHYVLKLSICSSIYPSGRLLPNLLTLHFENELILTCPLAQVVHR